MAGGAGAGRRGDLRRGFLVTRGACHGGVLAEQRKLRPRVIEAIGLPAVRRVAGRAGRRDRAGLVRAGVAAGTRRERHPGEGRPLVARRAGGRAVSTGEPEPGQVVIEGLPGGLEVDGRGVALRAVDAESSLVDVLMARRTGRPRVEERSALVAGLALRGHRGVLAVQREARDGRVVEVRLIERPQLRVPARVFRVALDAVGRHVAMDAELPAHPVGHRLVAAQAPLGRDLPAPLVALLAVGEAFQIRVGLRQWPRRDERPELRLRPRGGSCEHTCRDHRDRPDAVPPRSHGLPAERHIAEIERDPDVQARNEEEEVDERHVEHVPEAEGSLRLLQIGDAPHEQRALGRELHQLPALGVGEPAPPERPSQRAEPDAQSELRRRAARRATGGSASDWSGPARDPATARHPPSRSARRAGHRPGHRGPHATAPCPAASSGSGRRDTAR